MSNRYIFDFNRNAQEAYSYLMMYMLPPDFPHDRALFIKGLEKLLLEQAKIVIELNMARLIRRAEIGIDIDHYYEFAKAFQLDQIMLENSIDGLLSWRYIVDQIDAAMGSETFNVWALNPIHGVYVFECYGDFRINTFEREHVNSKGKYVATAIGSRSRIK